MSTTISKGTLFRVAVVVDDERLAQMKKAPELMREAVQAGADYWHTGILPKHFQTSAHGRYDYALRTKKYRQFKKGKPDLVNKGSLRRDLQARADFTQGANVVALRMHARVLNFVPRMDENSDDKYVLHRGSRGNYKASNKQRNATSATYPNLKREIKAITDDEREAVAQVVCDHFTRSFDKSFGNSEGRESDD